MSGKRYRDKLTARAVRFVTELGHPGKGVATRLGITEHTIYRWLREASSPVEEQQARDLTEAQEETKRLERDLQRSREEQDILHNAAAYFIKDPTEVRIHP